jgi:hypothetical protein
MTSVIEDELNQLSFDLHKTDDENLRLKMGELVAQMADADGVRPRLIFGKGNVKAQRERYRKRVMEEKRFQCPKCESCFTCNSGLKTHTKNKTCEQEKPNLRCEICDYTASAPYRLRIHMGTKKHARIVSGKTSEQVDKEKKKMVIQCPCGAMITKGHRTDHFKTNKHQFWQSKQQIKKT